MEAQFKITKKPDDANGKLRLSVGEQPGGYYCIYRGNKEAAIEGLRAALKAMELMAAYLEAATGEPGEPETAPMSGSCSHRYRTANRRNEDAAHWQIFRSFCCR